MENPVPQSYSVYSDASFVKQYLDSIQGNAWNAYYERPSTLTLLTDVTDKRILDAGCGPGIVSKELIKRGATVTAIDYSPAMIKMAKSLLGATAQTMIVDLNNGLPLFDDSCFDIVYSSLTVHYIDDLDVLFGEFYRVLQPGGALIFSTDHPESPGFKLNPVYEKRIDRVFWDSFNISLQIIRRPWNDIMESLNRSGFKVDKIKDAQPTGDCKVRFPDVYENLKYNRYFICVRALKQ